MRAGKALSTLILSLGLGSQSILSPFESVAASGQVNISTPLILQQTKREGRSGSGRGLRERHAPRSQKRLRPPDVIYYPTPMNSVAEMLRMAKIREDDVLYDLGSGDGRVPIMAARLYGIRAVGIEINPKIIWVAKERARGL